MPVSAEASRHSTLSSRLHPFPPLTPINHPPPPFPRFLVPPRRLATPQAWTPALDELLAAARAAPGEPLVLLSAGVAYLQARRGFFCFHTAWALSQAFVK